MTRHRKRSKLYTKLPSETIRDERLLLRSLGLLAVILNLPEDWIVRSDNLAATRIEGRDAVAACLRNMAETGYYRVERRRLKNGRFSMGTAVSEDSVPEWEEEYKEFGGKPIPLVEMDDGTFMVKRKDGRLTDDGFVGEYHPSRKEMPMPGIPPGHAGNGFSGSGQNDHQGATSEHASYSDITGHGFSGPGIPGSGQGGSFSSTEKYGRDVSGVTAAGGSRALEEAGSDLRAVGALQDRTARGQQAPTANEQDPFARLSWHVASMLPRRYRDGLPAELRFPMVHEIKTALGEGFEPAAILRYAALCSTNATYAADKHLPLLRAALALMRQDTRMGLVCPGCGHEPGDPFGPTCNRCRPDHHDLTEAELAQLEAARAWLDAAEPEPGGEHPLDMAGFDDQEGDHAAPQQPQDGARPRGAVIGSSAPYGEPDGDVRGARGARGGARGKDGGGTGTSLEQAPG